MEKKASSAGALRGCPLELSSCGSLPEGARRADTYSEDALAYSKTAAHIESWE